MAEIKYDPKLIPRVQAKIGTLESDDPKLNGKFCFEVFLSFIGVETELDPIGPFGPYETEAEAQVAMRGAAKLACETLEKKEFGNVSNKYYDMNEKKMRSWDEN